MAKAKALVNGDFEVVAKNNHINYVYAQDDYANQYSDFYTSELTADIKSKANANLKKNYLSTTYNGKSATYDYEKFKEFDYVLSASDEPIIENQGDGVFKILKPFGATVLGLDEKTIRYVTNDTDIVNGEPCGIDVIATTGLETPLNFIDGQIDLEAYKEIELSDGTTIKRFEHSIYMLYSTIDELVKEQSFTDMGLENIWEIDDFLKNNFGADKSSEYLIDRFRQYEYYVINFTNLKSLIKTPEYMNYRFKNTVFRDIEFSNQGNRASDTKGAEEQSLNATMLQQLVNPSKNTIICVTYKGYLIYRSGINITNIIDLNTEKITFADRLRIFAYTYMGEFNGINTILEAKQSYLEQKNTTYTNDMDYIFGGEQQALPSNLFEPDDEPQEDDTDILCIDNFIETIEVSDIEITKTPITNSGLTGNYSDMFVYSQQYDGVYLGKGSGYTAKEYRYKLTRSIYIKVKQELLEKLTIKERRYIFQQDPTLKYTSNSIGVLMQFEKNIRLYVAEAFNNGGEIRVNLFKTPNVTLLEDELEGLERQTLFWTSNPDSAYASPSEVQLVKYNGKFYRAITDKSSFYSGTPATWFNTYSEDEALQKLEAFRRTGNIESEVINPNQDYSYTNADIPFNELKISETMLENGLYKTVIESQDEILSIGEYKINMSSGVFQIFDNDNNSGIREAVVKIESLHKITLYYHKDSIKFNDRYLPLKQGTRTLHIPHIEKVNKSKNISAQRLWSSSYGNTKFDEFGEMNALILNIDIKNHIQPKRFRKGGL